MSLQYSSYPSKKSRKHSHKNFKQIEITIKKNGVIRIELIPFTN
jgi:hypothetical protein